MRANTVTKKPRYAAAAFDIDEPVFLLELWLEDLVRHLPERPAYAAPSKFPEVRQDVSLLVDADLPAGRSADSNKLERLQGTFASLSMQEVRAAEKIPFAEDAPRSRVATLDGLVVEAVVHKEGEGDDAAFWVRFLASAGEAWPGASPADGKSAPEQAATLAARLDGWAFKLSRWSAERLVWTRDDLLQPADKTT